MNFWILLSLTNIASNDKKTIIVELMEILNAMGSRCILLKDYVFLSYSRKTHNLLIICKEILSTIEIVKKIKYFVLYFNQACELGYTGGKC